MLIFFTEKVDFISDLEKAHSPPYSGDSCAFCASSAYVREDRSVVSLSIGLSLSEDSSYRKDGLG